MDGDSLQSLLLLVKKTIVTRNLLKIKKMGIRIHNMSYFLDATLVASSSSKRTQGQSSRSNTKIPYDKRFVDLVYLSYIVLCSLMLVYAQSCHHRHGDED
jgi:hypothetical protein